jgi:hypothetical protein
MATLRARCLPSVLGDQSFRRPDGVAIQRLHLRVSRTCGHTPTYCVHMRANSIYIHILFAYTECDSCDGLCGVGVWRCLPCVDLCVCNYIYCLHIYIYIYMMPYIRAPDDDCPYILLGVYETIKGQLAPTYCVHMCANRCYMLCAHVCKSLLHAVCTCVQLAARTSVATENVPRRNTHMTQAHPNMTYIPESCCRHLWSPYGYHHVRWPLPGKLKNRGVPNNHRTKQIVSHDLNEDLPPCPDPALL